MSDEPNNVDLRLILRNTEHASRDARAALDLNERVYRGLNARLGALEVRFSAIEGRLGALEERAGAIEAADQDIARTVHRIEQLLSERPDETA